MMEFKDLGLSDFLLKALELKGFKNPTPIQEQAIPMLLENNIDILGQAQTGTGKTAAFGLPLIELLEEKTGYPQALVLVPTRELAVQVANEIVSFKGDKKLFVTTLYGGASITAQLKDLRKGVEIVVGTPGRVIDHLNRGSLKLDQITHLILDEADEMLNMGFVEDIESIIERAPAEKRMLLFSATMPREILNIAKKYMGKYHEIKIAPEFTTAESVEQFYIEISERDKNDALCRIIDSEINFYGIVFCMTKIETDAVAHYLIEQGYAAEALHGDVAQNQREKTLSLFKKRKINIVVATDVAARGIDVKDLTHVINYSLPQESETYVHRIGRTGRAGKTGIAISLVTPSQGRKFASVKRVAKKQIEKLKLPEATDIIQNKVKQLIRTVSETITNNEVENYGKVAKQLMYNQNPEDVIAALLKINYENEFDENAYKQIKESSMLTNEKGFRGERSGREDRRDRFGKKSRRGDSFSSAEEGVRMFLAKGKIDDFNARTMVAFLENETGVRGNKINNVKVLEKFSFFTVSSNDCNTIMSHFKKFSKGKRMLVEIAKD